MTKEIIYETILSDDSKREEVTIDEAIIDFGSCSRQRLADPQGIHFNNHTEGKLSVLFVAPLDAVSK